LQWEAFEGFSMASITIRNLDDVLKRRLRVRAAEHGRSMEEEAREILRQAVGGTKTPKNLGQTIHARFAAVGAIELELPKRGRMRKPPSFS
jgi:antitoxin FitA